MGYSNSVKPYANEFNKKIKDIVENAKIDELLEINKDINFYKNHPSSEHFYLY